MKLKSLLYLAIIMFVIACGRHTVATPSQPTVTAAPKTPEPPKTPVATTAPTVAGDPNSATSENIAEGKHLEETTCVQCHRLYSSKEFTKEEWEPILKRMQKKARFDDTQIALVRTYIFSSIE